MQLEIIIIMNNKYMHLNSCLEANIPIPHVRKQKPSGR